MEEETEITFDHSYIYVNHEKFFPIIREQVSDFESLDSANGLLISVNCHEQDLDWNALYSQAEQAVSRGKWIVWELEFNLKEKPLFIEDSSSFFSYGLVIEEFLANLWQPFKEKTLGVSLFRGDVDFAKYFLWTEQHERHFQEKALEYPLLNTDPHSKEFLKRLFSADVFAEYLHRLASFLPDNLLAFCLLDVSSVESSAELSLLLSKERFQHLLLALKKSKVSLGHLNWEEGSCLGGWFGTGAPYFSTVPEIATGVCLPSGEQMSTDVLASLDKTFLELARFNIPFRVIEESKLNDCWDGIDDLIVLSSSVSAQGLRKLQGFLAAGGRVVSVGSSLGVANEVSLPELTKHLSEAEVLF